MANTLNTAKKAESMLSSTADTMGFEIADIEFVKEGQNYYLRVYLDKEGGITIDDCESFSRAAEKILDENDIIEQAYIFEVSSPGLDRPLKKDSDFEKFSGEVVDIKLYKPFNGSKEFQGRLKGLIDNNIVIFDEDDNEISFERKSVASIRLAVIF
ncbi:ribosome maturation factor RimP [Lachnospiraceae bacterium NSJ-143]|nr:ribosome maturation factor RimP [Lachnospiraceae bacterium NSJ-143]